MPVVSYTDCLCFKALEKDQSILIKYLKDKYPYSDRGFIDLNGLPWDLVKIFIQMIHGQFKESYLS